MSKLSLWGEIWVRVFFTKPSSRIYFLYSVKYKLMPTCVHILRFFPAYMYLK